MLPIPNQCSALGQLPVAAVVGPAGHHDLPAQQHLRLPAHDPGPGHGPRPHQGVAPRQAKLTSPGWRGLEYECTTCTRRSTSSPSRSSRSCSLGSTPSCHGTSRWPSRSGGGRASSALLRGRHLLRRLCSDRGVRYPQDDEPPVLLRRESFHFEALVKLVLIFSITWAYFFFNDYLIEWYGGEWVGHQLLTLQAQPRSPRCGTA